MLLSLPSCQEIWIDSIDSTLDDREEEDEEDEVEVAEEEEEEEEEGKEAADTEVERTLYFSALGFDILTVVYVALFYFFTFFCTLRFFSLKPHITSRFAQDSWQLQIVISVNFQKIFSRYLMNQPSTYRLWTSIIPLGPLARAGP